jgi:hypothetical protein
MKIRIGFVSNSSSTSFTITSAPSYIVPPWPSHIVPNEEFGRCTFGWDREEIWDIGSRVIWAYLQSRYSKDIGWQQMLEEVIKENSEVKQIDWSRLDELYNHAEAYIDHQSCYAETGDPVIFETALALKDFIFGKNSYIQVSNDNDY